MIFKSAMIVVGVVAVAFTGVVGASSFSTSTSSSEVNGSFEVVPTGLVGVNIGDEAPNIIMNNPKVVKAYEKYRKAKFKNADGFEIYSVSLDSKIPSWEAAIKKDNLSWEYHVSDLKKWNNEAAAMYGVSSIPMSFLVDEDGVIVAKNLRGFELHRHIDKHVKSLK